jgi:hypothetical protein
MQIPIETLFKTNYFHKQQIFTIQNKSDLLKHIPCFSSTVKTKIPVIKQATEFYNIKWKSIQVLDATIINYNQTWSTAAFILKGVINNKKINIICSSIHGVIKIWVVCNNRQFKMRDIATTVRIDDIFLFDKQIHNIMQFYNFVQQ